MELLWYDERFEVDCDIQEAAERWLRRLPPEAVPAAITRLGVSPPNRVPTNKQQPVFQDPNLKRRFLGVEAAGMS